MKYKALFFGLLTLTFFGGDHVAIASEVETISTTTANPIISWETGDTVNIWFRGTYTGAVDYQNHSLLIGGILVDSVTTRFSSALERNMINFMYSTTSLASSSAEITVTNVTGETSYIIEIISAGGGSSLPLSTDPILAVIAAAALMLYAATYVRRVFFS